MRTMILCAAFALCACSSGAGFGQSGGVATYDDIKAAQAACAAKGAAGRHRSTASGAIAATSSLCFAGARRG